MKVEIHDVRNATEEEKVMFAKAGDELSKALASEELKDSSGVCFESSS